MATWDDVRRLATALPEVTERSSHGQPAWRVADKLFVWERPLRKGDVEALGPDAPDGPILGARVADQGICVVLISHNMPEVLAVADRVEVLRMGRRVARFRAADTNVEQLVGAMTGALTNEDDDPTVTAGDNGRGAA